MTAMSSIPSLTEKKNSRRPVVWPTETPSWGDAPSFSFDYYDHGTHKEIGPSTNRHVFEFQELNDLKPVRQFIPDSWKRFFRRGRTKEEPVTLRNLEGVHTSPPVTPLLDISRESSLADKSGYIAKASKSINPIKEIKLTETPHYMERRRQMYTNYGEKRIDRPRRIVFQDEVQQLGDTKGKVTKTIHFSEKGSDFGILNRSVPTGNRPKPHMIPDYVLKYPEIRSAEEQEKYKAVFNDQYAEYKELYGEVRAAMLKFKELDNMMGKLTSGPQSQKAPDRVKAIAEKYGQKKNDPAFKEKRERCIYLKGKLTHIKKQIQEYDRHEGSVYF
ncbi:occludin/ELL domain-containing protein 1 isoform X2 [Pseudophryne corroboree]|uniref:occludin/ELL domain-containing protein 1 isoform X2 n=1 Tax=Pseudophryne corroboree TaxID=495146 RepID=UPI003081B76E